MTPMGHDEAMDKPLTMAESSLALRVAFGRVGAALASGLRLPTAASAAATMTTWADAQAVERFRVWCQAMQVDPAPSLEALKRSTLPVDEFFSRERSRIATEKLNDA